MFSLIYAKREEEKYYLEQIFRFHGIYLFQKSKSLYWLLKINAWVVCLEKGMGYHSWNIIKSLWYFSFPFIFVLKINFFYANHKTLSSFPPWKGCLFKEKLLHKGLFFFMLDHATVFHFTQLLPNFMFS